MQPAATFARWGVKALIPGLPGLKPHAETIFPPAFARCGLVHGRVVRRTLTQAFPKNAAQVRPFFRSGLLPTFTQGTLFLAAHLCQMHQRLSENVMLTSHSLCRKRQRHQGEQQRDQRFRGHERVPFHVFQTRQGQ